MKSFRFSKIIFSLGLLAVLTGCKAPASTYTNPLDVAFGDPFVLQAPDGVFYMYGTSDGIDGFRVYSSADLVQWEDRGVAYGKSESSWGKDCFWAPEVYRFDGRYYMFFSANLKHNPDNELETFRIGVAVADDPAGPFTELSDGPLFDPGYPVIDGNVLRDDDGRFYLYYSRCCYKHSVESELSEWAKAKGLFDQIEESWVYGVELKPDLTGIIGEPVALLTPPSGMDDPQTEWESRSVTSGEVNRRWTEGSFAFKRGGKYYMMYSANYFGGKHYAVGYATSDHPLGPFEKSADNPVLQKNTEQGGSVSGTGHNMVLTLPDGQMYCVYHGRTTATGDRRMVFIDRMEITPEGRLLVHGPTTDPQEKPKL